MKLTYKANCFQRYPGNYSEVTNPEVILNTPNKIKYM